MATLRNTVRGFMKEHGNNQVAHCLLAWLDDDGSFYVMAGGPIRRNVPDQEPLFKQKLIEYLQRKHD